MDKGTITFIIILAFIVCYFSLNFYQTYVRHLELKESHLRFQSMADIAEDRQKTIELLLEQNRLLREALDKIKERSDLNKQKNES